jgi:hypothetical protein
MTHRERVDVKLNTRAAIEGILKAKPDVVVAAMGVTYPPGFLALLSMPGLRKLARLKPIRKLFLRVHLPGDQALVRELRKAGIRTQVVGDLNGTRGIEEAVSSATQVGFELN